MTVLRYAYYFQNFDVKPKNTLIMRCKNCGWPNKPNEKTCVKCHAPLEKDDFDLNLPCESESNPHMPESGYAKTVREEDVFGRGRGEGYDPHPIQPENNTPSKPCPKCGYPVRPGTDKCPNCKFPLNDSTTQSNYKHTRMDSGDSYHKPTRLNNNNTTKNVRRGTVNPYMMNMGMDPSCLLKPLKRINERHEPEEQEYEGTEIILNRDNTEPNNHSITSRQQAILSNEGGHWYIEDRSDQKTTFVQATSKIELHDGDLVLLGNRLFEFHE